MGKDEELGISGQFASSRGTKIGSLCEDCAASILSAAALVYCPHCGQSLLTTWEYCPKCGGEIMMAPLVGFGE